MRKIGKGIDFKDLVNRVFRFLFLCLLTYVSRIVLTRHYDATTVYSVLIRKFLRKSSLSEVFQQVLYFRTRPVSSSHHNTLNAANAVTIEIRLWNFRPLLIQLFTEKIDI